MKYIIFSVNPNDFCDIELPFLFPDILNHSDMADMITPQIIKQFEDGGAHIISAGFVNMENMICHGISTSLGIKSREEDDASLIRTIDWTYGNRDSTSEKLILDALNLKRGMNKSILNRK